MSDEDDDNNNVRLPWIPVLRSREMSVLYNQLKSWFEDKTPHALTSGTVEIQHDLTGEHTSIRTLHPGIAKMVAEAYPAKIKLVTLVDILRNFSEKALVLHLDMHFNEFDDGYFKRQKQIEHVEVAKFDYEDFVWKATLRRNVVFMPNKKTGLYEWFYITHIQLPMDSHVMRHTLSDGDNNLKAKIAPDEEEVRMFTEDLLSFVHWATSRPVGQGFCDIIAKYDQASGRASFIVNFPGNYVFEISWEYGYHEGALRFTDEQIARLKENSDRILNSFSSNIPTWNTKSK